MRYYFLAIFFIPFLFLFVKDADAQKHSKYRDSLEQRLLVEKNDTTLCTLCHLLSLDFNQENTDSALYWADKAWKRVNDLKLEKGIAVIYSDYSTIYTYMGDQPKAISYLEKSVKINLKLGNEKNLSADYINLAASWHQLSNYPKALEYLLKALPIADKLKDNYLKGIILGNLAVAYESQKNYPKSRFYTQQQMDLAIADNDDQLLSSAYFNMGQVYLGTKENDSAIIYFNKGLKISRVREDGLQEAGILAMLAICYENNNPKKMEFLLQAQKIFDNGFEKYSNSINNIGNIGGTYASMALHDSLGQFSKNKKAEFLKLADTYLQKAVAYATETNDLNGLSNYSDELAQVQEGKGDYKNALINFKLSAHLEDSLFSQENKNAFANKEALYLEQLMEKKNELHKLQLQKFWLIGAIVLALLIIATALLINYFRFQKVKSDHLLLKKEAEEKTKELLHQNSITESELKAIRSQMNPHFIFNVPNSLESYIMVNDKQSACKLVQKFAGLSRLILENSTHSLVVASKEWKALILYTELQALRYNNGFTYKFSSGPDIDIASVFLPPMLIQPLIENAILHGMLQQGSTQPHINVLMEKLHDQIKITIEDNGPGISDTKKLKLIPSMKEKSLGLQFIEDRIKILNQNYDKPQASFVLKNKIDEKGAIAILVLPIWTGMEIKQAI
ncbi:MAG: tetratricopeptide repeat protein [Ferruginibacter sp.]